MRRAAIIALCSVSFIVSAGARSETKIDADTGSVWISGEITEQDAKDVEKSSASLERYAASMAILELNPQPNVTLSNNIGGDAIAAMRIGNVVRQLDARTLVEGECFSSCPLIFIAGVVRSVYLEAIGLHRPYLAAGPANREILQRSVPGMLQDLNGYVSKMGVSHGFYEQMVNIDPSQMKIFRDGSIYNIVPENDAVYQEVIFAYAARRFGITSSEMRQRKKDSEACEESKFERDRDAYMKAVAHHSACVQAILWGLSERVYEQRAAKSKACEFTKADFADLLTVAQHASHRTIWDHPAVLRREACVRDIMLGKTMELEHEN